jgi:hypothetical protein
MTTLTWKLVEVLALPLTLAEREVVLGDLIETQTNEWRGIREILGLVVRRQLQLWKSWRPWIAAAGLAFPCSLTLIGFSFAISMELRGNPLSNSAAGPLEAISMLCQILVLLICSWAAGLTVASLSRRSLLVSAVSCFLPCLFCLMRFHYQSPTRLCLLLFLLPAIAGVRFSRSAGIISRRCAVPLALAATISMAVLAECEHLWVLNWVLIGPAWYLVVLPARPDLPPIIEKEITIL